MTCHPSKELASAIEACEANDVDRIDHILKTQNDPRGWLNEVSGNRKPLLAASRSVEMAEKLLNHGADIAHVSRWWASGLFVNPGVDLVVGRFLIEHGAKVTAHAAAGLGFVDKLKELLAADASLVHSSGGDGCTPLHFARSVETAAMLIEHGANVDARDDDHDSTPAQWLIGDSPDVSAFLIERGATADIFLAAALGNRMLAERVIDADRSCLAHRIGKAPWRPIGYQGQGGTILQWTLGFNCYAHQIAARKGHGELLGFLSAQSDVTTQFLVACVMVDRPTAESIAIANPGLVAGLPDVDLELPARYCWETNISLEAVRLMLDCGFPVDFPERSHGFSPLHNAAWAGNIDLVELLIERGHSISLRDPEHQGTPLDWAIHCCVQDGRHPEGEYGRVVGALIDAGCPWDASIYPTSNAAIDSALLQRLRTPSTLIGGESSASGAAS